MNLWWWIRIYQSSVYISSRQTDGCRNVGVYMWVDAHTYIS